MQKTKTTIRIENAVTSATLNQKIDLRAVVKSYPGARYGLECEVYIRAKESIEVAERTETYRDPVFVTAISARE